MRIPQVSTLLAIVTATLAQSTSGCATWKPQETPDQRVLAKGEQGPVRLVKTNGETMVIIAPLVEGDSVFGATEGSNPQRVAIPLADVKRIEKMQFSLEKTASGVLATQQVLMGVVLMGGFLAILLSKH